MSLHAKTKCEPSLHAHLESDSLMAVNCSGGSGPSSSARCKTIVTLERLNSC